MNAAVGLAGAGLFAVTNIDDIVVLALFFAHAAGRRAHCPDCGSAVPRFRPLTVAALAAGGHVPGG